MNRALLITMFAISMPLASQTNADQIIYDNGAGGATGINSTALFSDTNFNEIWADDVTLPTTTTVTKVDWTGAFAPNGIPPFVNFVNNFVINIYSDNGGSPMGGLPLASFSSEGGRIDTGINLGSLDVFEFSADVNFEMVGGTTYWISIFDNIDYGGFPILGPFFSWGSIGSGAGNTVVSPNGGVSWISGFADNRADFRLSAVPEPSSVCMLIVGLIAGLRIRSRSRVFSS